MSSGFLLTAGGYRKPAGNCCLFLRCLPASYPSLLPWWGAVRRRRTVHGLRGAMTLLGRHLTPLLAQLHASFRGHLPETIEGFAHLLLPLRRQRPVLLPALAEHLPLIRRHGAPLRKSLLRTGALLRRHRQPALTTSRERLLALRGQAVPLTLMALQQLLLLRRQRVPRSRRGGGGGRGCHSRFGRRRLGRRRLRKTGGGGEKTCADKPCPDHFFASCGGGAGGTLPRGAFFKNSHQAASPVSSEPKNSRKPSSGATVVCPGVVSGVVAGVAAGGGACATGGGSALAVAHNTQSSSPPLPAPVKGNLGSRSRIRGLIRKIIKIDIVLQHIHRIC
jgi:hypothetical protein